MGHHLGLLATACIGLLLTGCQGGGSSSPPNAPPRLTLQLDATLDGDGVVKATSLATVDLLTPAGAVAKSGTLAGGSVVVELTGVASGDYFLKVNGDADDLVPTRIDDPTRDLVQSFGTKLRTSVIGSASAPSYRIQTFPKGQGGPAVQGWSTGTDVSPVAYGYALMSFKTVPRFLETRVLGTGQLLVRKDDNQVIHFHGQGSGLFPDWLIGVNNHGKPLNYASDGTCLGCHGASLDTKPATYADTVPTSGWCYKCHLGKGGPASGLVDPTR